MEGEQRAYEWEATSQSANSKASTVEQAIEYIKQLKSDLAKKDAENQELKTKVTQLEQKV